MTPSTLFDWPEGFGRTAEEDRETTNKFETGIRKTKKHIEQEMERLDADEWRLDEAPGNDPSVVLRWVKNGQEFAVAADGYKAKKSNLRELYLWVNETRMRSTRNVRTGQDNFAAAALPSGEEGEGTPTATTPDEPPWEILGVRPDAPEGVIEAAARHLRGQYHPDSGEMPDRDTFIAVNKAEEAMLDG